MTTRLVRGTVPRPTVALALACAGVLCAGAIVVGADAATPRRPPRGRLLRRPAAVLARSGRRPAALGLRADIAIDRADRWYSSVPNGSSTAHSFIWTSRDHGKSFQMIPGRSGSESH